MNGIWVGLCLSFYICCEIKPIRHFELIIVGGGLAGCALAWQAHLLGRNVCMIDRQDCDSSSRVAAGLVTPITGSRAAASWRWDDFYRVADPFYRTVEQATGEAFWSVGPAVKVFDSAAEADRYHVRWTGQNPQADSVGPFAKTLEVEKYEGVFRAPFGACSMFPSARLDTQKYIRATLEYFAKLDRFQLANLDCDKELDSSNGPISFKTLGLVGDHVALCQGVAARENRFFRDLPLHPARGDILTIVSNSLKLDRVLHGSGWIVPLMEQQFLIGATYDRVELNSDVSTSNSSAMNARKELIQRWEAVFEGTCTKSDLRIVAQRAAVRPASYDRHPLLGRHELHDRIYCLNGLGSKGSLMAPYLASCLLDCIQGESVPSNLYWNRRKQ